MQYFNYYYIFSLKRVRCPDLPRGGDTAQLCPCRSTNVETNTNFDITINTRVGPILKSNCKLDGRLRSWLQFDYIRGYRQNSSLPHFVEGSICTDTRRCKVPLQGERNCSIERY